MLHRVVIMAAVLATAALVWVLPAAAQDAGYAPPEPPQPTFFEVPPPTEPPDNPPATPPDNPPTVPPGPPPEDPPAPPPDDPNLPATGSNITNGMAAAGVFLVSGTGLVLVARRRRQTHQ